MRGLILSDGKPGHVNQSRALCALLGIPAREVALRLRSNIREGWLRAKFGINHKVPGNINKLPALFSGVLDPESLTKLQAALHEKPVVVVSAGSTVAIVNLYSARAIGAKSAVLMRPSGLQLSSFDLVVLPEHDRLSIKQNNVVYVPVALSYFDQARKSAAEAEIAARFGEQVLRSSPIALVIGGSSPYFDIRKEAITDAFDSVAKFAMAKGKYVIGTTSRRTPEAIEDALKKRLGVLANEEAVKFVWGRSDTFNPLPAILDAACCAIVTEDSVSMISEAVLLGRKPLVLEVERKKHSAKFARFQKVLEEREFAKWVTVRELQQILEANPAEAMQKTCLDLMDLKAKIAALLKLDDV